jgi:hypothetical protein
MISFWRWLISGTGNGTGIKRFVDWWLLLHILAAGILSYFLPISLKEAATTLLLPVAGIFIGLSFAWGGNAQALLQSEEIEKMSAFKKGGFADYVYTFQSAILLILITLCLWGIAGLGFFDLIWPICSNSNPYKVIGFILFFLSSMTLRECWHVVLGAQILLLVRFQVKKRKGNR